MNDNLENTLAKASKIIQKYTYPLFIIDDKNQPDQIATCLFLNIKESIYLITAAHALEGYATDKFRTRGHEQLFSLGPGHGFITHFDNKDHFDIAAIYIDNDIINKHKINIIPPTMLVTNIEVTNPQLRAICGFINKRNK